ncbi:type II secretion system protein [Synechococcus sp. CCY9201]|uniref:type II secretion system protein n=1 Tax=Synechococcus sp. CCY9201 TaxID=174697 RepID=UPI002B21F916|nr:type II secretion system protein [Synechococcus sp. CCY9201]MEA5475759.1 type II secretion system protein [Synechococcus sp. CCY9201]
MTLDASIILRHNRRFCDKRLRIIERPQGFTILEVIVLIVILALTSSVTAIALTSANRMTRSARLEVKMNEDIQSFISEVRQIGDMYTCCSGTCSVTPPAASATVDGGNATSSCATNNPRDDRYFFPYQDNPATTGALMSMTCQVGGATVPCAREPDAITEVCKSANNTAFMTPLKTAVDAIQAPANTSVATTIPTPPPPHVLRITITDTVNNRTARVYNLVPPMSRWCP